MTDFQPRRENLVRAMAPGELTMNGNTLFGHFARFNEWNLIDSAIEGRFLERLDPGAFDKTLTGRSPKVLFQHGKDPQIGDKVIAASARFSTDDIGPTLEGELLDGVDPLLRSGLAAGAYGMSYRFSIPNKDGESWVRNAPVSDHNPSGLPERTIREVMVFEAGPVTWPADPGTNAGVRSLTDDFAFDALTADPERLASLIEAKQGTLAPSEPTPVTPVERAEPEPATPTETPESRSIPVAELHPVDKAARVTELEESIRHQAEALTGTRSIEEQARWDADKAELLTLRADLAAIAEARSFVGQHIDTPTRQEPTYAAPTIIRTTDIYDMGQYGPGQVRSVEDRDQKLRDGAMRSLEASSFAQSNVDQARAKEGVQELLDNKDTRDKQLATRVLLTGSPQYRKAFMDSLTNMRPTAALEDAHERAAALAVTGTTTTGGYMIPYQFDPSFIKTGAWTNINPYRQVCRVEQIVGRNKWQGVSVGAVPAIYETEALAVTEAGPTFSNPSVQTQRASAFVSLSYETLQDKPDIITDIADLIQEGKDTLEEAQFSVGVGTTVYPLGMFVKSTFTPAETITNDTFAVADLDATEAALPIRHRREAIWMLSRGVIRIIQGWETAYGKLFNSTLGYPAVGNIANNPGGNTGMSLLGYPVWETPSAPVTVTTDDTIVGILVSPKNYIIVDRVGMNVELVPNLIDGNGKVTGQRGVFAMFRNSAKALNADAGRQININ